MTDENIWSRSLDSNNIKCLHAKKVKKLKYSQKRWGRFWLNLRGYFFFQFGIILKEISEFTVRSTKNGRVEDGDFAHFFEDGTF